MSENRLGRMNRVLLEEDGQDTVEYALVVAVVGLGAVACLKGFSSTYNWLVSLGAYFISWLTPTS